MQKKLIPSIHHDPLMDQNQMAHAISAQVTTRQGFDLSVVAMSQKKSGFFTPLDTPRKALLSFINGLQNGTERTIEQIIFRAINAVTLAIGSYTKRRGGAPCGLTAGIVHDGILYTIRIGSGEIFYIQKNSLHLLTYRDAKQPTNQVWLGETNELAVQQINMQKIKLSAGATVLICRPEFVNAIVDIGAAFKSSVLEFAQQPETFSQLVADWAQAHNIDSALTLVAQQLQEQAADVVVEAPSDIVPDARDNDAHQADQEDDAPARETEAKDPHETVILDAASTAQVREAALESGIDLGSRPTDTNAASDSESEAVSEPEQSSEETDVESESTAGGIEASAEDAETSEISGEDNVETEETADSADSDSMPDLLPEEVEDEPEEVLIIFDQTAESLPVEDTAEASPVSVDTKPDTPDPEEGSSPQQNQPNEKRGLAFSRQNRLYERPSGRDQGSNLESSSGSQVNGVDQSKQLAPLKPATSNSPEEAGVVINEVEEELVVESMFDEDDVDLAELEEELGKIESSKLDKESDPIASLPKNRIEADLVGQASGYSLPEIDFGDDDSELDTQKMEPVFEEIEAPARINGQGAYVDIEQDDYLSALDDVEYENRPLLEPDPTQLKDRSGLIRFSVIGLAIAFIAIIGIGIYLTMESIIFSGNRSADVPNTQAVSAEEEAVSAETNNGVLVPVAGLGPALGSYSQGTSLVEYQIFEGSGLGARGLIAFSLEDGGDNLSLEEKPVKSIYAWPGSSFSFDKKAAGSSFRANEKSTFFLDSREGTIRPELAGLFGIVESSAGCMSVNYRDFDQPLIMSCYSGTCRWRGPLNQNYEIPAGQRLSIVGNSRSADGVSFEPIYRTETTALASTLKAVPAAREVADQCLEPYIAERRQLSVDETTVIANTISADIAQQIGYTIQGNSRSRRLIDEGDRLNIRGLSRLVIGDNESNAEIDRYELYAWPGSSVHFNPDLQPNEFEVAPGSTIFLNSTDTTIRPIIPDIFSSAESINGCMTLEYQDTNSPIVMSCYAGTCQWNGALDRKYRIPVGQRLAIPSNPQSENEVLFEAIYPTEATVVARTLGSIQTGKAIADICVESFIPERQIQIIAPETDDDDPTPTPEPVPVESEEEALEESEVVEEAGTDEESEVLPVLDEAAAEEEESVEEEAPEPTAEPEG